MRTEATNEIEGRRACGACGQPGHYRKTCPNPSPAAELATAGVSDAQLKALENRIVTRIAAIVGGRKVNARQAADILGVSVMTVHRWANEGRIAHVRVNGRLLIEVADLPSAVAADEAVDEKLSAARARGGL